VQWTLKEMPKEQTRQNYYRSRKIEDGGYSLPFLWPRLCLPS
jgi:hypothetical protein